MAPDGIPEESFIVLGARVASRRLVEFAIKKMDATAGISPEANPSLRRFASPISFAFVRSFVRRSLAPEDCYAGARSDTAKRVSFSASCAGGNHGDVYET